MIMRTGEKGAAGCCADESAETFGQSRFGQSDRRQRDKNLAFTRAKNVFESQMAFAFFGLEIARGDETAEPSVSRAVGRVSQNLETVRCHQPHADQELYFSVFGF